MVQRLDLPEFVSGGGPQMDAPLWGLGDLFGAPGLAPISGSAAPNLQNPDYEALMLSKEGLEDFHLPEWEEIWGPSGQLSDPFALMRYLNIANVMGPEAVGGYMTDPTGYEGLGYNTRGYGTTIYDPVGYEKFISGGQATGDYNDALLAWLYNMSHRGFDQGVGSFGKELPGGQASLFYDPSSIRYSQLPKGSEMWRKGDWEKWAQGEGAKSLWDLVTRPAGAISTEASWREDPSLWFNPAAPAKPIGILGEGSGLGTVLGGGRMTQFTNQLEEWENRQQQIGALGPEMFMSYASRNDPAFARSQLARYHGAVAPGMGQWGGAMQQFAPETADYSYLIQAAMQPYLIQNQLKSFYNQQGMNI